MYDHVYAEMVDENVATPMDESEYYFINISGRQVKTEEEAAGHHISHHIIHPNCIMFRDEVGTDTNHMDYGNNGGQRYISIKGMRTNLLLSKASVCFTLMGVTAANGEPALCVRIYCQLVPD